MTDEEMRECAVCMKHGHCAIEAAGGHVAILNSEEREKLIRLFNKGIPVVADADMRLQGFVKNKSGKWTKREEPMTADEKYVATYEAANIVINFSKWLEPIFTGAKERVENEYAHNYNTGGRATTR